MTLMSLRRQRCFYFNKKTEDDKRASEVNQRFREWVLFRASEELVFTSSQN